MPGTNSGVRSGPRYQISGSALMPNALPAVMSRSDGGDRECAVDATSPRMTAAICALSATGGVVPVLGDISPEFPQQRKIRRTSRADEKKPVVKQRVGLLAETGSLTIT